MITLEQGVELVWHALNDMQGGEIYVKRIPSMRITNIAEAVAPGANLRIIGIRPNGKIHEQMIGPEDAPQTYEYEGHYKILPAIHNWSSDESRINKGKRAPENFMYSSDNNTEWMSVESLRPWVEQHRAKIGSI